MTAKDLSNRDYRALARFRYALRSFEAFSAQAASQAGLSPSQHQLLLAIRGFDDPPPSISDMAERLQIKVHSTTELVARAEAKGLVERSTDPSDGRRVVLALTTRGEDLLAELSLVHKDELRRFRTEMNNVLSELDHKASSSSPESRLSGNK